MITFDIFLFGLMVVSVLTGLVTEAFKKIFEEHKVKYHANTISGIVAAVLSTAVGVGYSIFADIAFTPRTIVCIVALIFVSWLCAMVGYDKVIKQFKTIKGE